MFKVLGKLRLGDIYCVSVEGNILLLRNGLKLIDEKKNTYEIRTVTMTHYQNVEDYKRYAEIVLYGDVDNIGDTLFLSV